MSHEFPDAQAGFRKGRGTRQILIIKKPRDFQRNIYFCFIVYVKVFDYVDHNKLWKILRDDLSPDKSVCRSGSNS